MKQVNIPIQLINIDNDGVHLQIKIKINSKIANVIIDTGASRTVFDKKRMAHFALGSKAKLHDKLSSGLGTNTMKSHKIIIKKICLGSIVINNYESVLLDLTHVNKSYEQIGLKPIDGILGGDLLQKYHAVISYEKAALIVKWN